MLLLNIFLAIIPSKYILATIFLIFTLYQILNQCGNYLYIQMNVQTEYHFIKLCEQSRFCDSCGPDTSVQWIQKQITFEIW